MCFSATVCDWMLLYVLQCYCMGYGATGYAVLLEFML